MAASLIGPLCTVCCWQALETRIQKNIAKKGDSIRLKPMSAQKLSAHKSQQSPTMKHAIPSIKLMQPDTYSETAFAGICISSLT